MVNLRFRAYDPVLARFIGRDTFGGVASAPQTGNRYAYALANPLRFTDPSGHFFAKALSDPTILITLLMIPIPGLGVIAWAARFLFGAFMGITALTGYDPLTGQQVDGLGRLAAGALFLVPVAGRILSGLREAWALAGEAGERAGPRLGAALRDLRAGGSGLLGDVRAAAGRLRTAYRESWLGGESGAIRLSRAGEASSYGDAAEDVSVVARAADPAARRVTLRQSTKQAILDAQRAPDGKLYDPNTGLEIPEGGGHFGHRPGLEWWRTQQMAREQGWTRNQIIEYENDPSHYWYENPSGSYPGYSNAGFQADAGAQLSAVRALWHATRR